jgi:uncharacterized protein (DUF305 family)
MKITLYAVAAALAFASTAYAQQQPAKSGGPSTEMHNAMLKGASKSQQMEPTGNVDEDFVRMMRQHHQTGLEMAQVQARAGKDEKAKEMARKISESQKKELKELDAWLSQHSGASRGGSTRSKPKAD